MDPALWELLKQHDRLDPERSIEAIIRLREPDVSVPGVRIVSRFGRIATCRLAADSVLSVRAHRDVLSLKAARRLTPDLGPVHESFRGRDRAQFPEVRTTDIRRVSCLGLSGAGVVVGAVDWGVDIDYEGFKYVRPGVGDANTPGLTRFIKFWDQRALALGSPPSPYGYGAVHNRADIDRALRERAPYERLGYHPAIADRGTGAHGTHVLDIAAGNGRAGGPMGVAPESDLVFVHLADSDTGGLYNLGDSVRLLEAVDFISRTADGQPWVVNVSVGRHGGPHDGSTLTELAFDELLRAAPGRFIVQSTGNYGRSNCHAQGRLNAGEQRQLTFTSNPADRTINELEIWYDGADEFVVRIDPPGQIGGRAVLLGHRAEISVCGEVVGRIYHRAGDPNNGDNHIDAFLYPNGQAGTWTVTLEARRASSSGRFHAWLERDDSCPGCQARFAPHDADPTTTTGTIANGHLPLIVGAFDGHHELQPAAAFSSVGPTRDGRRKPDLAAPGVAVLAARSAGRGNTSSSGMLVRKSGTSMAAPHVTGAVALVLQARGREVGAGEIRSYVLSTCDPPVRTETHGRLGHGYLNTTSLVTAVRQTHAPQALVTKEHRMNTDDATVRLRSDPARAYREFLYRPEGTLAQHMQARFEVVAAPGGQFIRAPRTGDVLLNVDLGSSGSGRLRTLDGPRSTLVETGRRLPVGSLLLRPRGVPEGLTPSIPTREVAEPQRHVAMAREVWTRLFGHDRDLMVVKILDLRGVSSKGVADFDFLAWTDSGDRVYVSERAISSPGLLVAVLYHEALHVRQFLANRGQPPRSYANLMRFQGRAYRLSAQWLRQRLQPSERQWAETMNDLADTFENEIREAEKDISGVNGREAAYRTFLITSGFLPPHRTLRDLYRVDGPSRRRSASGESVDAEVPAGTISGDRSLGASAAQVLPGTLRQRIVAIAEEERSRWGDGAKKETDPTMTAVLQDYYRIGVRREIPTADLQNRGWQDRNPWSAVFISWVMRKAGAGATFAYSAAHREYISAAKRNAKQGDAAAPFWAHPIDSVIPDLGDLICVDRGGRVNSPDVVTYDNVDNGTLWNTHCDIVVAVDRTRRELTVVGGNVSNSVKAHKVGTDAQGFVQAGPSARPFAVIKVRDGVFTTPPTPAPIQATSPTGEPLGKDAISKAVRLNSSYRSLLGWADSAVAISGLIGLPINSDDATFARAVARWQQQHGLVADGIIGPNTWLEFKRLLSGI